jgi:thioredoxin-like negative regulator of GroEL
MNQRVKPQAGSEARGRKIPETGELRSLRHRLSLAPHNTELRLHLAHWLAERGRRHEALEELRELVQLDPNHLGARKLREELLQASAEAASDGPEGPRASRALH